METLSWRRRAFGSLKGRLELVTSFSLFVGFTLASSSSLLLSDLNLKQHHHMQVMRQTEPLNRCLASPGLGHALISDCLTQFSGWGHFFWVRTPQGDWLYPSSAVAKLPSSLLAASKRLQCRQDRSSLPGCGHADAGLSAVAMLSGPFLHERPSLIVKHDARDFIVHKHSEDSSLGSLFTAEDVTSYVNVDGQFLFILVLIWGGSLLLSVIAVRLLVARVIKPLLLLNAQAGAVTADNLASQRVMLEDAPEEVRELEDSFNHLLERLATALDQQREFAGTVSHELRTPLTVLQGYVRRILRHPDNLTAQQKKSVLVVQEESARISRLVSDLLDLSRGDAGRLNFELEPVELLPVVRRLVQDVTPSLKHLVNLKLADSCVTSDLWIMANRDRLSQVLLNLIENAAKYSPDLKPIVVGVSVAHSRVLITVADQGVGIPDDDLSRVFDRFYRGSNVAGVSGSGVGLSVVKLLVDAMNGSIRVESQIGSGTVFTVEFSQASDPSRSL